MPINRELKERWIARLEDPASRKARRKLWSEDGGMCCLGHLADVFGATKQDEGEMRLPDGTEIGGFWGEEIGLTEDEVFQLYHLNDNKPGFPIEAIRNLPETDD